MDGGTEGGMRGEGRASGVHEMGLVMFVIRRAAWPSKPFSHKHSHSVRMTSVDPRGATYLDCNASYSRQTNKRGA